MSVRPPGTHKRPKIEACLTILHMVDNVKLDAERLLVDACHSLLDAGLGWPARRPGQPARRRVTGGFQAVWTMSRPVRASAVQAHGHIGRSPRRHDAVLRGQRCAAGRHERVERQRRQGA